jgi:pimeloyl-ACP methyl ester carboxylesterase
MSQLTRRAAVWGTGAALLAGSLAQGKPRKTRSAHPKARPAPAKEPAVAAKPPPLEVKSADLGAKLKLAYVELGLGAPVIFVHGSLSDYTYWTDQLAAFAETRRAIAYSRRYNWPNDNPPARGYSATTDAQDLAGLIELLCGGRPAHIVGHSYGALAGLILATRRPELIRSLTLAEAPAMSLLAHAPGPLAPTGKAMLADVRAHMVAPMKAAFRKGDRETGVATFINYCFGDPQAWEKMSAASRAEALKDAHEWDVMMTSGELFPEVSADAMRKIRTPTLLLSGAKSYPFFGVIDETLMSLLPNAQRIVLPTATHQMWLEEPQACRRAALELQGRT